MTTSTASATITVVLSDRRPLKIKKGDWPIIAQALDYHGDGHQVSTVLVRAHADGRRIVTATIETFPYEGGNYEDGAREFRGGFLVEARDASPDEDETIRATRRVGGLISRPDLAAECIGDLPEEEV